MNTAPDETGLPPEIIARRFVRACDRASLATAHAGHEGWPYASLVMVACGHDASPILLMSDLAEHAKNIAAEPRVSLLFDGTGPLEEPLNAPRVTVLGRARRSDDPALRARYLARHPAAERFADFGDFHIYGLEVERAHLVEGFGRVRWMEPARFLCEAPAALAEAEPGIVAHMNDDHSDAIALYATALLGRTPGDWRMTGIDPEGCDLRHGGEVARLDFAAPIGDATQARKVLVELVKQARAA
jgi:putative heme iron utilization protein